MLPTRRILIAVLWAAALAPATSFSAEPPARFAINASLQTAAPAISDSRFSLRGQLTREAGTVNARESGAFRMSASFSPSASTCIIPISPDLLFRDRFQFLP